MSNIFEFFSSEWPDAPKTKFLIIVYVVHIYMFLAIRWLSVTFTIVQNQVGGCRRFGKKKKTKTVVFIANGRDVMTELSCDSELAKETWCLSMFYSNMMMCYDF